MVSLTSLLVAPFYRLLTEPDVGTASGFALFSSGLTLVAVAAYVILSLQKRRGGPQHVQNLAASSDLVAACAASGCAAPLSAAAGSGQAALIATTLGVAAIVLRRQRKLSTSGSGAAPIPHDRVQAYRRYYSGSPGASKPPVMAAEPDTAVRRAPCSDDAASFSFPVLPLAHPHNLQPPARAAPSAGAGARSASGANARAAKRTSAPAASSCCGNSGSIPATVETLCDVPSSRKGGGEASGARDGRRSAAACCDDAAVATAALELASQAYSARMANPISAAASGTVSAAAAVAAASAGAAASPAPYTPQRPALAAALAAGDEAMLASRRQQPLPSITLVSSRAGAALDAKLAHHQMPR